MQWPNSTSTAFAEVLCWPRYVVLSGGKISMFSPLYCYHVVFLFSAVHVDIVFREVWLESVCCCASHGVVCLSEPRTRSTSCASFKLERVVCNTRNGGCGSEDDLAFLR